MNALLLSLVLVSGCPGGQCGRPAVKQPSATQVYQSGRQDAIATIFGLRQEIAEVGRQIAAAEPDDRAELIAKRDELRRQIDALQDRLVASHRYEMQHKQYPASAYRTPNYGFIEAAQRNAVRCAYRAWR